MKKVIIIIWIIIWLIVINFSSFLEFKKNNWKYKYANFLYKQWNYREALNIYKNNLQINQQGGFSPLSKNSEINHNIWNTIYKIAEREEDSKLKINYLEEALLSYRKSLKIKFNEETKKNLEFVQEKIKQEKEKLKKAEEDKKKKEEEKKQEWEKVSPHSVSPKGREVGQWDENNEKTWEKKWKNKEERKLSKEWEKFIEDYEKKLKEEEKRNRNNFNKVYKENRQQNIFDNFEEIFWNSQFNNSLLDKNEKKDW